MDWVFEEAYPVMQVEVSNSCSALNGQSMVVFPKEERINRIGA